MNILYMIGNGFDIHIGLVYLAITYLGSVHCFCGLKILILNGSGLQIQTNGTTRTSAGSVPLFFFFVLALCFLFVPFLGIEQCVYYLF